MKTIYKEHKLTILFLLVFITSSLSAQINFTNSNSLLSNADFHSGIAMAVADMNGDKRDDIVRLSQARTLTIETQMMDGTFSLATFMDVSDLNQWTICVADVDQNGYNDVMTGGKYDGVKIITANADATDYSMNILPGAEMFAQGSNLADINNDGHIDAFVCHDDAESRIWGNNGVGIFEEADDWIDMATTPISDNSGNYGSIWVDFDNDRDLDLYIAKCRQNVDVLTDPRRINALFVNDGNGNYTEAAEDYGLKINWQSWTADFQDLDNDGDMDCFVTNHDHQAQILENDGKGNFTEITSSTNLNISGSVLQGLLRDFDNDGFVDILVSGGGSIQALYQNNGDMTFTEVPNLFDNNDMESFAIGDLNHDGFLDVYAGYGYVYTEPSNIDDVIWMNDGNDNNFFVVDLVGTTSNINAIGARVEIYGDWGVQIREVRSGESYGIMNSLAQHFGLGSSTEIDYVVVKWPSGKTDVIENPSINEFLTITESDCVAAITDEIDVDGDLILCDGEETTLTAPESDFYLWSTGEETSSIVVANAGSYSVIYHDENDCYNQTSNVSLSVTVAEIPNVFPNGATAFCIGSSIVLTASEADAYTWSNDETTQSITVNQVGNYTVTSPGACGDYTSEVVSVSSLEAINPTADDVNIPSPGSATLMATGTNPNWYDQASGGTLLGTGNTLNLPLVSETTTYFVEDVEHFGPGIEYTGLTNFQGNNPYSGNQYNGGLYFNALNPFTLISVKVYTDTPGIRLIEVQDANGLLVHSLEVNVPEGESRIDLNFDIAIGDNYLLTTNTASNFTEFGFESARFQRSNSGVNYPYTIDELVSVTNSNLGNTRYYYFFDWEVQETGVDCVSERIDVQVVVGANNTVDINETDLVSIYPNPTNGKITLQTKLEGNINLRVFDLRGKLVFENQLNTQNEIHHLHLKGLADGIYSLQVINEDQIYNGKIILQK